MRKVGQVIYPLSAPPRGGARFCDKFQESTSAPALRTADRKTTWSTTPYRVALLQEIDFSIEGYRS